MAVCLCAHDLLASSVSQLLYTKLAGYGQTTKKGNVVPQVYVFIIHQMTICKQYERGHS